MSTPIDREKLASIGYLAGGRTRDAVRESRRTDGIRTKETTDQLGNIVTEHADNRQDVTIKAPTIRVGTSVHEDRG